MEWKIRFPLIALALSLLVPLPALSLDATGRVKAGDMDWVLGETDISSSVFQKRVSGTCPAGQSIREIAQDGSSVTCEVDDSGSGTFPVEVSSGGTSCNTTTCARAALGLTIGASVQAYDADLDDLADGSLTASKIADGLGVSQIDETAIQRRITGTCAAGSSIRVIDETGGSLTCETDDTGSGPTSVKLNGSTSTYGTSFIQTGLSFSLSARTTYQFEFLPVFQTSVTTTGIKFGVNGPASPAMVVLRTQIPISLTAVTMGGARGYNSGTASASVDTTSSPLQGLVKGIIVTGAAAGNLDLVYGSEIINTTATVRGGSVGYLTAF